MSINTSWPNFSVKDIPRPKTALPAQTKPEASLLLPPNDKNAILKGGSYFAFTSLMFWGLNLFSSGKSKTSPVTAISIPLLTGLGMYYQERTHKKVSQNLKEFYKDHNLTIGAGGQRLFEYIGESGKLMINDIKKLFKAGQ